MDVNMLVSARDDFHWQWECGECDETTRGFGSRGDAETDAQKHWHDKHEEN